MKYLYTLCATFALTSALWAARGEKPLFNVAGEDIYPSEFFRFAEKSSEKNLDTLLRDFTTLIVKAKEAEKLKTDTLPQIRRIQNNFRSGVVNRFLKGHSRLESLAREAFEHSQFEVSLTDLCFPINFYAQPEDSLKAFERIREVKKQLDSGENFDRVCQSLGQDTLSGFTVNELENVTAFDTYYPMEKAIFGTEKGKVSDVFRDPDGYHLIRVTDKRPSQGEVEISRIATRRSDDPEGLLIELAREQLQKGDSFEEVSKTYTGSGPVGRFHLARLPEVYREALASLKEGEYTAPFLADDIRQIIRLDKRTLYTDFDPVKEDLKARVEQSDRAGEIYKPMIDSLRKEYDVSTDESVYGQMEKTLSDMEFQRGKLNTSFLKDGEKIILTIEDRKYSIRDLYGYLFVHLDDFGAGSDPKELFRAIYRDFTSLKILEYYSERDLEKQFPQVARQIGDFKRENMAYALLAAQVWKKAAEDREGLMRIYEQNPSRYMWGQQAVFTRIETVDRPSAERALEMLKAGKSTVEISSELNRGLSLRIKASEEVGFSDSAFPQGMPVKIGISDIYPEDDKFVIYRITEFLAPEQKTFEQAEAEILEEHKKKLSEEYMENLLEEYDVSLDKKAYKSLEKEFKKKLAKEKR